MSSSSARKFRVLILHSRYLSGPVSGENRVVEDEIRLLREGGHRVGVWQPEPRELSGLSLLKTGVQAVWSTAAVDKIHRLVDEMQPDILHLHNLYPLLSPAAISAVPRRRAAVVVTLHNYRMLCLPGLLFRDGRICEDCVGRVPLRGVLHRCYRGSALGSGVMATSLSLHRALGTFRRVDLYLGISEFVKHKHVEAGFPSESIRVKPHFSWGGPRRPRKAGRYFLYLGRLSPEKGVETLVAGWRPDFAPLLIAGDGPQRPRLEARAGSNVDFLGPVPPSEVPELIAGARALLAPSTCFEGAGKSVLESYAVGVPVIASRIGGLIEAVEEGVSGFLVAPGDPDALGRAIGRMMDDREVERLGEGARQLWEERFSPTRGLRNLEDAYREAIDLSRG